MPGGGIRGSRKNSFSRVGVLENCNRYYRTQTKQNQQTSWSHKVLSHSRTLSGQAQHNKRCRVSYETACVLVSACTSTWMCEYVTLKKKIPEYTASTRGETSKSPCTSKKKQAPRQQIKKYNGSKFCLRVRACVKMRPWVYVPAWVSMCTRARVWVCAWLCTCAYVCVCTCAYVCVCTCTCTYVPVSVCVKMKRRCRNPCYQPYYE